MKRSTNSHIRSMNLNSNLYVLIHETIQNGGSPYHLPFKKSKIYYYVKKLLLDAIIEKIGYGVWGILQPLPTIYINHKAYRSTKRSTNSSRGHYDNKPKTQLHSFELKFPIIKGKIISKDWEIKERLKHWIPKYKKLNVLGGLELKSSDKNLLVKIKKRDIKDLDEVYNLAFRVRTYIFEYMKVKENVIIDVFEAKVQNIHIATEDKNSESKKRKGGKFALDLKKKSEKIFPKDDIDAKAWIDGSPFQFSAETNDLEWKREYLNMPFSIKDIREISLTNFKLQDMYAKNIKLHMKVMKNMDRTLKKIREEFRINGGK